MDPGWFAPIDAYCERNDPGFWAEPLNALSNGAFLVAATAATWREHSAPVRDPAALGLAALVAVVGIGSFQFHTFATYWAKLADVIPIALFIYAYFLLAMRRFFGLGAIVAVLVTLVFAGFNLGLTPALDTLTGRSTTALTEGSIGYLPAVLALVGVGSGLVFTDAGSKTGPAILAIAALFLMSLMFRTVDAVICSDLPLGTHALWHLINATVLYRLIAVAIDFKRRHYERGEAIQPHP